MDDLAVFENLLTADEVKDYFNSQYSICIDGIIGTSYTFENLHSGIYKYRIKAIIGNNSSEWSAYKEVELRKVDTFISVPTDFVSPIAIYTINGIQVNKMTTKGVYILDYGNYVKKIVYMDR